MLIHSESQPASDLMAQIEPVVANLRRSEATDSSPARPVVTRFFEAVNDDLQPQLSVNVEEVGTSADAMIVLSDESYRMLLDTAPVANRVSVSHSMYRGTAAGSLAVPTIGFDVSAQGETVTLVQDTYRAYVDESSIAGLRIYYGGTVRLAVTVFDWTANAKLSLPLLAAQVDANQMRASYRFEVLGLADTAPIADHLPHVGEFTSAAYLALLKSTHECAKILMTQELKPVRLFIETESQHIRDIVFTYGRTLRHISSHGVDGQPSDIDNDDDEVNVSDWVVTALWSEATRQQDPRDWARATYNRFATTFPEM